MALITIFQDPEKANLVNINGVLAPKGFYISNPLSDFIQLESFKSSSLDIEQGNYYFQYQDLRDGDSNTFASVEDAITYLKGVLSEPTIPEDLVNFYQVEPTIYTLYEIISTGTTSGSLETQAGIEILKDTFGGADLDISGLSSQNYPTNESIFDSVASVVTANFNPIDTPPDWQLDNSDSGGNDYALLFRVRGTRENLTTYLETYSKYGFYEETSRAEASGAGVQTVTGDGVGGTATDVVMTFPNASEVANAFDKSTDNASDITMASSSQTVQNKIVNIQNETDDNTQICTSAASFISTVTQSVGTQGNSAGTNIQVNLTNILGANNLTYSLSSGSVTIPVSGWYKVSFKALTQTSTNNRQNTAFVVKRNLVNITGTLAAGYNRNPANNDASSAIPNIIPQFQFSSGDTIGLYAIVQGDGNQNAATVAQECVLTLEFIGT